MTGEGRQERVQARREYLEALKRRLGVSSLAELAKHIDLTPTQIYNLGRLDRHAAPALIVRLRKLAPELDPAPLASAPDEVEAGERTVLDAINRMSARVHLLVGDETKAGCADSDLQPSRCSDHQADRSKGEDHWTHEWEHQH